MLVSDILNIKFFSLVGCLLHCQHSKKKWINNYEKCIIPTATEILDLEASSTENFDFSIKLVLYMIYHKICNTALYRSNMDIKLVEHFPKILQYFKLEFLQPFSVTSIVSLFQHRLVWNTSLTSVWKCTEGRSERVCSQFIDQNIMKLDLPPQVMNLN